MALSVQLHVENRMKGRIATESKVQKQNCVRSGERQQLTSKMKKREQLYVRGREE